MKRKGYVYWVQAVPDGLVKIGFSQDVRSRYTTLQAGSPVQLTLLGLRRGTLRDERKYHERFKAHRSHGEWFVPAPEVLRAARRSHRFPSRMASHLVRLPKPPESKSVDPWTPQSLMNGFKKGVRHVLMFEYPEFPPKVEPFVTGLAWGRALGEQVHALASPDTRNPPTRCGNCQSDCLGPIGKNWTWCMACGSVGNGEAPGEWIAPDPNVQLLPTPPELERLAAYPPPRIVKPR